MAGRALKMDVKKSEPNQPNESPEPNVLETVSEDAISALAYQLWHQRGCPIGSDQEDWFQAEQELRNGSGTMSTAA
jgi:hypothetical protein